MLFFMVSPFGSLDGGELVKGCSGRGAGSDRADDLAVLRSVPDWIKSGVDGQPGQLRFSAGTGFREIVKRFAWITQRHGERCFSKAAEVRRRSKKSKFSY